MLALASLFLDGQAARRSHRQEAFTTFTFFIDTAFKIPANTALRNK